MFAHFLLIFDFPRAEVFLTSWLSHGRSLFDLLSGHNGVQLLGAAMTGNLMSSLVGLLLLFKKMQETLLADSVFSALEFVKEWLPRFERLIVHEDRLLIICTFYAINY